MVRLEAEVVPLPIRSTACAGLPGALSVTSRIPGSEKTDNRLELQVDDTGCAWRERAAAAGVLEDVISAGAQSVCRKADGGVAGVGQGNGLRIAGGVHQLVAEVMEVVESRRYRPVAPVPLSATVCCAPKVSLSVMVSVPVKGPAVGGVKAAEDGARSIGGQRRRAAVGSDAEGGGRGDRRYAEVRLPDVQEGKRHWQAGNPDGRAAEVELGCRHVAQRQAPARCRTAG